MKFNKICVLGMGYIGLPTASTFASRDIHVLGVDVNDHVIDTLQNGELHIIEARITGNWLRMPSLPVFSLSPAKCLQLTRLSSLCLRLSKTINSPI